MDECDNVYGVNLNDKITPKMVRDAIIQCFFKAEAEVMDSLFSPSDFDSIEDAERVKYQHVKILIKKMFNDVHGDFKNPTKESLIHVIDRCAKYAESFRDKEEINKHYNEIMSLIKKL